MSADIVPTNGDDLPILWKFAQRVARTEFVPAAFRNRPDAVLAAIQYGRELGIGPMQSLQSIHVIQGKPSLSPEAMRARIFAAGHTVEVTTYNGAEVTLKGIRGDTGATASVTWTLEDAKRAGLAGKDSWKTYPRSMLLARATSELARLLFPDVIAGASYVPEELGAEESDLREDAVDDYIDLEDLSEPVHTSEAVPSPLETSAEATTTVSPAGSDSLPGRAETTAGADEGAAPAVETATPNAVRKLQERAGALQAAGVKVADARKAADLPLIRNGISASAAAEWAELLDGLEYQEGVRT